VRISPNSRQRGLEGRRRKRKNLLAAHVYENLLVGLTEKKKRKENDIQPVPCAEAHGGKKKKRGVASPLYSIQREGKRKKKRFTRSGDFISACARGRGKKKEGKGPSGRQRMY